MIIKPKAQKAQIISVTVRLYFLTIFYPVNFSHVAKGYDFDIMERLTSRGGGKKDSSVFFFFFEVFLLNLLSSSHCTLRETY